MYIYTRIYTCISIYTNTHLFAPRCTCPFLDIYTYIDIYTHIHERAMMAMMALRPCTRCVSPISNKLEPQIPGSGAWSVGSSRKPSNVDQENPDLLQHQVYRVIGPSRPAGELSLPSVQSMVERQALQRGKCLAPPKVFGGTGNVPSWRKAWKHGRGL